MALTDVKLRRRCAGQTCWRHAAKRSWQKFIALMDQMYACNWMQATILTLP
jgi:hypothetical protein